MTKHATRSLFLTVTECTICVWGPQIGDRRLGHGAKRTRTYDNVLFVRTRANFESIKEKGKKYY